MGTRLGTARGRGPFNDEGAAFGFVHGYGDILAEQIAHHDAKSFVGWPVAGMIDVMFELVE